MSQTPKEVNYLQKSQQLELVYADGKTFRLTSEYLRVFSPSAEVQGHTPEQAVLQAEKKNVRIAGMTPQGNYAIRIEFDDEHDSGIYSWEYLYELGANHAQYWAEYLAKLAAQGVSRESNIIASSSVKRWSPE
jgi:DUF971 family protein